MKKFLIQALRIADSILFRPPNLVRGFFTSTFPVTFCYIDRENADQNSLVVIWGNEKRELTVKGYHALVAEMIL